MDIAAGDRRYDESGPIVAMAVAKGYVMARRPKCVPFVLSVKAWFKLSVTKEGAVGLNIAKIQRF